jgi:hypothetical protein
MIVAIQQCFPRFSGNGWCVLPYRHWGKYFSFRIYEEDESEEDDDSEDD